jgi:hypothetical protein
MANRVADRSSSLIIWHWSRRQAGGGGRHAREGSLHHWRGRRKPSRNRGGWREHSHSQCLLCSLHAIAGIASASMRPRVMHACPEARSSCPMRAHHQPTQQLPLLTLNHAFLFQRERGGASFNGYLAPPFFLFRKAVDEHD